MATTKDLAAQQEQKRGELAALFAKHKTEDGQYDMPIEVVEEVNKRNEELNALGKSYEAALQMERVAQENAKEMERLGQPINGLALGAGKPEKKERKTLGQLFITAPEYEGFRKARVGSVANFPDYDVKTLFQTSAGWDPEDLRTGRVIYDEQEERSIESLIPMTTTTMSDVVYMEETTFTNNAAEASEGAAYGESVLVLTEKTSAVRKIAVSIPVTDEQMADEVRVAAYLDNRLRFMLRQRLASQLLVGNGTAPNLRGLNNVSGINTQAKGTDPTLDAIYKAMVQIRVNGFAEPDIVALHPNDWQDIRLTRTADGIYIYGGPAEEAEPRIWGKRVMQTTHQTQNTGLVATLNPFTELSLRSGIEMEMGYVNDDFTKGKKTIRASFRCAFIAYRPLSICTVTGI